MKFTVYVAHIAGNRVGDRSEKVRIETTYQLANVGSSLIFDVPIAAARKYYLGQKITVEIHLPDEAATREGAE